uniref:Uncharacterized protein n=1 Tax=Tetraselmis sp. GSL018 TaxID=582737 RepID=A0A061QXT7_9CHLO
MGITPCCCGSVCSLPRQRLQPMFVQKTARHGSFGAHRWCAGGIWACNPRHCIAKFAQCPDPGSQNVSYHVVATFCAVGQKVWMFCKGDECSSGKRITTWWLPSLSSSYHLLASKSQKFGNP